MRLGITARALAIAAVALLAPTRARAELKVVYPNIEERGGAGLSYKILDLALARSGRPYSLSVSTSKMNQARARRSIDDGTVSIVDFGTSAEYEEHYRAVYFPIDRGMSGYRLFIINKELAPQFAAIKSLAALKAKKAGQGPGWSDIKILESAGITVETAAFEALFRMVDSKRFDFFPLGFEEVFGLLKRFRDEAPNSVVEERLVLHYPFGRLFFVRKDNVELADAVLAGLEKAFADGSLLKLMESDAALKSAMATANLKKRTIIEVDNPNLTPRFKEIPAKYFFRP